MKKTVWVLLWCAALIACLYGANKLMMREDSHLKYDRFFAEDEKTQPFDVFLMGTSHVFDGVYPMPIWRDHGIACYNLANSSECLELTEWTLRIALQYHKPKVALVDVYYVDRSLKDAWAHTYRHLFLDAMPLTPIKVQSVMQTFPQKEWMEFILPFSLYHGRWEEMLTGTTKLTMNSVPCMMGAEMRLRTVPAAPWERTTEMNTENMPGKDAIRRIAALCKQEGIELLLTAVPSAATLEEQRNKDAHDDAEHVESGHNESAFAREEGRHEESVDRQLRGTAHERREQDRHLAVAFTRQGSRRHDGRNRTAESDQHRYDASP